MDGKSDEDGLFGKPQPLRSIEWCDCPCDHCIHERHHLCTEMLDALGASGLDRSVQLPPLPAQCPVPHHPEGCGCCYEDPASAYGLR